MPRLRLRKMKHRFANCFVCILGGGKAIKWTAVGQVTDELPEKLCYELLGKHPEQLELIANDDQLAQEAKEKAILKAPQNKAAAPSKAK